MRPLTLDDLLSLDEYVPRRREFFESHSRYLDRYRRVRIGPRVTLLFENRQTLWYRLQEVIRIARLAEPARLQQELDLYNRFLPGTGQLQAVLLLSISEEAKISQELSDWQRLQGDHVRLVTARRAYPATIVTCRAEDRSFGAAHWVQFQLDSSGRRLLADLGTSAHFEIDFEAYRHRSQPLSDDVRQSLMDDLELSDRDAA